MSKLFANWRGNRKKPALVTQPGEFAASRSDHVGVIFTLVLSLLAIRALTLHIYPSKTGFLDSIAGSQYRREVRLAPWRGTIYDRKGDPLAISIRRPSIAINPRVFSPTPEQLTRLSQLTGVPVRKIRGIMKKKSYFAWLARQIDHRIADEIQAMALAGVTFIREPARFYPAGSAAGQLIGLTGSDSNGITGLELQFDKDLRGRPVHVVTSRDARGNLIFRENHGAVPEKSGNSLHLTLDRVIQEIAETELAAGVAAAKAAHGVAIVADPHTGKVLGLANFPSVDLNDRQHRNREQLRNHALLDRLEPGSTTKPLIIAQALSRQLTTLEEQHDCHGGALRIGRHVIHDTHGAGTMTTAETIINSSNICTYKIAQRLGREGTFQALQAFGIGGVTGGLGFPGEARGRLTSPDKWPQIQFANIAFGQGFLVTPLEMVQALSVVANGGRLVTPRIVERIISADGLVVSATGQDAPRQVLSPEVSRSIRKLLARVVSDPNGTGSKAATPSYSTGGKTGTAQKVEPGKRGYAKDKYIASFVGFAPVDDPHLVIYVLVDEPTVKPYYGGVWAAPIFAQIAQRSLQYLNVAPDKDPGRLPAGSRAKETVAKRDGRPSTF